MPDAPNDDVDIPAAFKKPRRAPVIREPWRLLPFAFRTLVTELGEGDDPESALRVLEGYGAIPRLREVRTQQAWDGELSEMTSGQLGQLRDRLNAGDTALAVALFYEFGLFDATPNTWEGLFGLKPGEIGI